MPEKNDSLQYDRMVENALRGVLRDALTVAAEHGLPGEHHFYINFLTAHPGVVMPEHLRERHPEEMTIVLQHRYWGLEVGPTAFEVTLSFNQINERLRIPFEAVTAFADPSAKFGLQFRIETVAEGEDDGLPEGPSETPAAEQDGEPAPGKSGEVIALDAFRKK